MKKILPLILLAFTLTYLSNTNFNQVQSKETARSNNHLEFQASTLSPVFYHSNQNLVDFIYSALVLTGDAAAKSIGQSGTPANILFFIKDGAIKNQRLNLELFREIPKEDGDYLKRIHFSNDICALEIPNPQLSILVLDPSKIRNDKQAKICAIYALSIILGADLSRPDKQSTWQSVLVGILNEFSGKNGKN
ncbi:MAG: hypothetical protein ABJO57_02075 [Lentilitoribacter sp.]